MAKRKSLKDPALNKQLTRVNRMLKDLQSAQICHILRELNKDADRLRALITLASSQCPDMDRCRSNNAVAEPTEL